MAVHTGTIGLQAGEQVRALSFATGAREHVVPQNRRWRVRDEVVGYNLPPIDRPDIFFDPLSRQPA